jgi:ParB family transcriptional regulator, chromosome partitioning protein
MAFTVTDDHARQEHVWDGLARSYNTEPYCIHRQLTEGAVSAADTRAQFVGLDAYDAAGGIVTRDLFQDDNGGWLQDKGLLDRLVGDKLTCRAGKQRGEGCLNPYPKREGFGFRYLRAILLGGQIFRN